MIKNRINWKGVLFFLVMCLFASSGYAASFISGGYSMLGIILLIIIIAFIIWLFRNASAGKSESGSKQVERETKEQIKESDKEADELKKKLDEADKKIEEKEKSDKKEDKRLEDLQKKIDDSKKELGDKIDERVGDNGEIVRRLDGLSDGIRKLREFRAKDRRRNDKNLNDLRNRIDDAKRLIESGARERRGLIGKVNKIDDDLKKFSDNATNKLGHLNSRLNRVNGKINTIDGTVNSMDDTINRRLGILRDMIDDTQRDLADRINNLSSTLNDRLMRYRESIDDTKRSVKEGKREFRENNERVMRELKKLGRIQTNVGAIRMELEGIKATTERTLRETYENRQRMSQLVKQDDLNRLKDYINKLKGEIGTKGDIKRLENAIRKIEADNSRDHSKIINSVEDGLQSLRKDNRSIKDSMDLMNEGMKNLYDELGQVTDYGADINEINQAISNIEKRLEKDLENNEYLKKVEKWLEEIKKEIPDVSHIEEEMTRLREDIEKLAEKIEKAEKEVEEAEGVKVAKNPIPKIKQLEHVSTGSDMLARLFSKKKNDVRLDVLDKAHKQLLVGMGEIGKIPMLRHMATIIKSDRRVPTLKGFIYSEKRDIYANMNIMDIGIIIDRYANKMENEWPGMIIWIGRAWSWLIHKDDEIRKRYSRSKKFADSTEATSFITIATKYGRIGQELEKRSIYFQSLWSKCSLGVWHFNRLRNKLWRDYSRFVNFNTELGNIRKLIDKFEIYIRTKKLYNVRPEWGEYKEVIEQVKKINNCLENIMSYLKDYNKPLYDNISYGGEGFLRLSQICISITTQSKSMLSRVDKDYSQIILIMKKVVNRIEEGWKS